VRHLSAAAATIRKRLVSYAAVLALTLAAGTVAVPATLAQAASSGPALVPPGNLACVGSGATNYHPGLITTVRPVDISGSDEYGPCISSDSTLTSGSAQVSAQGTVSCTRGSFNGTITIQWNNNKSSTVSFTATISLRADGEVVTMAQGVVAAGEFEGDFYDSTDMLFPTVPSGCRPPLEVISVIAPRAIVLTSA
jgi:hypothetical protein